MSNKLIKHLCIAFIGLMFVSCSTQLSCETPKMSRIMLNYDDYLVLKIISLLGYDYEMSNNDNNNDNNQKSLQINSNEITNILRERFSKMERDTTAFNFWGYDVGAKLVCQIEGYGYDVLVVNKFVDNKYLLELNGKCMKMDTTMLNFVVGLIHYHKSANYPKQIKEETVKSLWKEYHTMPQPYKPRKNKKRPKVKKNQPPEPEMPTFEYW